MVVEGREGEIWVLLLNVHLYGLSAETHETLQGKICSSEQSFWNEIMFLSVVMSEARQFLNFSGLMSCKTPTLYSRKSSKQRAKARRT